MDVRLKSSLRAASLMRRAELEGGFSAVLAKGDPDAGAIIVILTEKGRIQRILERIWQGEGQYLWQDVISQTKDEEQKLEVYLAKRRKYDPDLWMIELDVVSAERFAAEMSQED